MKQNRAKRHIYNITQSFKVLAESTSFVNSRKFYFSVTVWGAGASHFND